MESMKEFIDNLKIDDIPWHRMVTAYGTAERYPELFRILDSMENLDEVKQAWNDISAFEHQSTFYTPAPFAVVFLARIREKALNAPENPVAVWLADKLTEEFSYYSEICGYAEKSEHPEPLPEFSDMLNERYLLPADFDFEEDEDVIDELIEKIMQEDFFYSLYYYTGKILSEISGIEK